MSEISLAPSPFKGLMPYSESETDARFFFGRGKERDIIIANLQASRLTLLYGASGVGKSSVLRAGVTYRLRELGRQGLRERGTPEFCVVKFNRWRDNPVAGLLDSVRSAVEKTLDRQDLEPAPPSASFVEKLRHWTNVLDADLLIILDQFEEYFLYHPQDEGAGSFDAEFACAARDPRLRVNFLISIREDAIAKLDRFTGRVPNLFSNRLRIEHLSVGAARDAIEKTIAQYNSLHPDAKEQISVEPELIAEVLDGLRVGESQLVSNGRANSVDAQKVRIEAPLFQLVMARLWDEEMSVGSHVLRHATLLRFGGAENILQNHLSRTIKQLSMPEQEIAAEIFRYLVTPSGTKIAQTAADLAVYSDLPEGDVQRVLVQLCDVRILRAVAPPSDQQLEPRYEIFHDVLASAITNWRLLFEQQLREQEQQAFFRKFTLEQKARYLRWGILGLLCASVTLIALTVYAFRQKAAVSDALIVADEQRDKAEKQQSIAETQRYIAEVNANIAVNQKSIAEAERQRARDAQLETERQKSYALQQLVIARAAQANALHARSAAERANHETQVALVKERKATELAREEKRKAEALQHKAEAAEIQAKMEKARGDDALNFANFQEYMAKIASEKSEKERLRAENALEMLQKSDQQPELTFAVIRGVDYPLSSVAFSPDLASIVATGDRGEVIRWETTQLRKSYVERKPPVFLKINNKSVTLAITSPGTKEQSKSSAASDSAEAISKVKKEQVEPLLEGLGGAVKKTVISSDGNLLVTINDAGKALIWNLQTCGAPDTPCQSVPLETEGMSITTAAFNPQNANRLATGNSRGLTQIWDLSQCSAGGKCTAVKNLSGHEKSINSVAFNRRGDRIVTASEDGTARIWDAEKGKEKQTLRQHSGLLFRKTYKNFLFGKIPFFRTEKLRKTYFPLETAVFNPENDNLVVTGSVDGMLRLWDGESGISFLTLRGHGTSIRSVNFSPHGKYLISASDDLTVRIWQPCKPSTKADLFETTDKKLLHNFAKYCDNPNVVNEELPTEEIKKKTATTLGFSLSWLSH